MQVHVDACRGVILLPVGATSLGQCHVLAHRCTMMGEVEANGEGPNSCHTVRLACALWPFPLSNPTCPGEAGARRKTRSSSRAVRLDKAGVYLE